MTTPRSGRMEFGFTFGKPATTARSGSDPTCAVLVLADFSGRSNRGVQEPLSTRRRLTVTVDNVEGVFATLGAALTLPRAAAGQGPRLPVQALEAFHPDSLLTQLKCLTELHAPLRALAQPARAKDAAETLQAILSTVVNPQPSDSPAEPQRQPPQERAESDSDTLSRLLGQTGSETAPQPGRKASPVDHLIRQAVESSGSLAPSSPAGAEGLRAAAHLELASRLRAVLHDPDFQCLEAAWRGMDFLLRRCPNEECIRYSILDATLDELAVDIDGLRRMLRDSPPQLVVANHTFGGSEADLSALEKLAGVCTELGTQLIGGAHPLLAGVDAFDRHADPDDWRHALPSNIGEKWAALRASPEAQCVGLALPRFLLRQPYGQGSDPIEGFGFEEVLEASDHESFLWGNSAFLCAQVLVERFVARVEGQEEADSGEVGELPLFNYRQEDGESAVKPCAEAWLVDRAAAALLQRGLTPVMSVKGRDAVRLPGLVSISG